MVGMSASIQSHHDLIVLQRAMKLVEQVYSMTSSFRASERFGITSQMRRASISIPFNIAEGRRRGSRKDFRHFLYISFGSCAELETQVRIAQRLKYCTPSQCDTILRTLEEVMKMLNVIIRRLDVSDTTKYEN